MVAAGHGRIINITSQAGVHRWPLVSGYSVSKAAVVKLTENLALEIQRHGISVFSVHPGLLPIGMGETVAAHEPDSAHEAPIRDWTMRRAGRRPRRRPRAGHRPARAHRRRRRRPPQRPPPVGPRRPRRRAPARRRGPRRRPLRAAPRAPAARPADADRPPHQPNHHQETTRHVRTHRQPAPSHHVAQLPRPSGRDVDDRPCAAAPRPPATTNPGDDHS